MAHTNNFIAFLRHYGPIPASDNMYDELIQSEINRYGITPPIEIPPSRLEDLVGNFGQTDPNNVILTGTAGDGKTYHCRRVWEHFGGDRQTWIQGPKVASMPLSASGRTLVVVKDLSELTAAEKAELLPNMCEGILGHSAERVYLIAANDGQLLATFREWAEREGDEAWRAFKALETMLVDEHEEHDTLRLRLYNLSRLDPSSDFDALLEKIIEHPQWSKCEGCSHFGSDEETSCPIRINRKLLQKRDEGNPFRERLSQLLSLATANRLHLPIRHLLLLAVNTLLGDHRPPTYLLTCQTACNRADNQDYAQTNPYSNVFGGNLPESRRRQYQAFTVLDTFGIGRETDNSIDNLLIYGPYSDAERYARIVGSDEHYGAKSYARLLEDYLEGEREYTREFMRALERQRQRLFFSLDKEADLDPWRLGVYRSAGVFLEFCDQLSTGKDFSRIASELIRGLNRTFCGMMIDDTTSVFLASSGGDGRGQIASILSHELEIRSRPRAIYLTFEKPKGAPRPQICVIDSAASKDKRLVHMLPLHLTHFEYLMRVAHGSLPSSFSRQCFEDFLDFKLRVIDALDQILGSNGGAETDVDFRALTVESDGRPRIDEFHIGRGW